MDGAREEKKWGASPPNPSTSFLNVLFLHLISIALNLVHVPLTPAIIYLIFHWSWSLPGAPSSPSQRGYLLTVAVPLFLFSLHWAKIILALIIPLIVGVGSTEYVWFLLPVLYLLQATSFGLSTHMASTIFSLSFILLISMIQKDAPVYVNYVTTISSSSPRTPLWSSNHPTSTPDSNKTIPLPSPLQHCSIGTLQCTTVILHNLIRMKSFILSLDSSAYVVSRWRLFTLQVEEAKLEFARMGNHRHQRSVVCGLVACSVLSQWFVVFLPIVLHHQMLLVYVAIGQLLVVILMFILA